MNGIEIAGVAYLAVVLFIARFIFLKLIKMYMMSKEARYEDEES